jgi:CRISPR-associated endonuclease Csn1
MSEKTLGLDLGTNSIGWAIVEKDGETCKLLDRGVTIFSEGVARDKSGEHPMVETRTNARATRRHYFRRRLRKIELLKVLLKYKLCPELTSNQLEDWRKKKAYPLDKEFIEWQRTDDNCEKNPYHDRYVCLTEKLDLTLDKSRYVLGRALYHLNQRRGFLSNRKDQSSDSDGTVKSGIDNLSKAMENAGCQYVGEYFYSLYGNGGKIRNTYTSRLWHIKKEFDAICDKQQLNDSHRKELSNAIFYQRPLKSQKGAVGKCTFEKNKARCPISHPAFEEFRMLQFINNIKIKTLFDSDYRQLNESERAVVIPLFFRKSKDSFDFEEIAKKIAGKKAIYCTRNENADAAYRFNMDMSTSASNSPVTAVMRDLFGENWISTLRDVYAKSNEKTNEQIVNDIWHALFNFDDDEKLKQWAITNLGLDDIKAETFIKCPIHQGYASLSLNAINKILPYLRLGIRYDQAVFLANLEKILPEAVLEDAEQFDDVRNRILSTLNDYNTNSNLKKFTKDELVKDVLIGIPGVEYNDLQKLYHPSMIETYPEATLNKHGELLLGSPRIAAIKNPMAMRALFRLRHLINTLLREHKIDRGTKINIEFSRNLNNANEREAIAHYQRDNEKERVNAVSRIKEYFKNRGKDIEPTEDDVLKYQLWEEQKHQCIYTGNQIDISEFIGENPKYDIEHTVPRSNGGDNSKMNKTLCDAFFNRSVKRAQLPAQLSNYDEIIARVEQLGWKEKIVNLKKRINRTKGGSFATKEAKDANIQQRNYLTMQLKYWQGKLERFTMTEVPQGFSNRQGVDIGIIGRYAREYLATVFREPGRNLIYIVKGAATAEFRKMWGIQDEYTKKERVNHSHHCIDAIVIACIGKAQYDQWAIYKQKQEMSEWDNAPRFTLVKPWATFTQDVKAISNELLVVHSTSDNTLKRSKKKLRKRGKVQKTASGKVIMQQGDTARASLHKQSFYGAIERDGAIKYVVRKPLDSLKADDIKNIVDDVVREKIEALIAEKGFANALSEPIWMNKEKGVQIKKVRLYVPSVTNPIHLKPQRDLSVKEYKQYYHVANDANYCLAIYEGTDNKGKTKRSYKLVNNLEAVNAPKGESIVPNSDENDYPLKWLLKVGQMVLLYENIPNEIYNADNCELVKRLYEVTGLSYMVINKSYEYGRIVLKYHQEAHQSSDLKAKNGVWHIGEEIRPAICLLHTQFNALAQGQDFEISDDGEITFNRVQI